MADSRERAADADLVAATRSGNAGAFDALVRRHYRAAFAVALAVCGTRADAEDVCQDALIKALERIDSCRTPEKFAGWLCEIVRNRAFNHLEKMRVRAAEPLQEDSAAAGTTPHDTLERRELGRQLEDALKRLPPKQREVVLLHDLDGWSHREIAGMIGTSEVMSRQHLFNARQVLRELLSGLKIEE
jgi:RNA polymerase sigma-70 factor (ECF subfamily)